MPRIPMHEVSDLGSPFEVTTKEIEISGLGDNEILAPIPGKKIVVTGYLMVSTLAVIVRFKNQGAGALSGPMTMAANSAIAYAGSPYAPAFISGVGKGLDANLTVATGVSGHIAYFTE